MSMRSGASVCQLFAVRVVPRAARTVRATVGASVMHRSHRTRMPRTTDAAAACPGSQTPAARQRAASAAPCHSGGHGAFGRAAARDQCRWQEPDRRWQPSPSASRDAGYEDVRTHLQSGNVLFSASAPTRIRSWRTPSSGCCCERFEVPILVVVQVARRVRGDDRGGTGRPRLREAAQRGVLPEAAADRRRGLAAAAGAAGGRRLDRAPDPGRSTSRGSRRRRPRPASNASWRCPSSSG